ncbi:ESPR-type extended signal peptide-containing protein [Neisseria elongata]|uniref:ESPR domain-containing protein n=1 Tax=Neisseria elongata TaxID=495 RepID=UPI0036F2CDAC
MNKHCHKIVFNRRRGILMAVAETAVGQGKSPGERSGGETGGGNRTNCSSAARAIPC